MLIFGEIIIPFVYIALFVTFAIRNEHRHTKTETNLAWLIKAYNKKRDAAKKGK